MATTAAPIEAPVTVPAETSDPMSSKIVRFLTKTPVYLVLAFIGLLWLVPTLGLFFTSLLEPGGDRQRRGGGRRSPPRAS